MKKGVVILVALVFTVGAILTGCGQTEEEKAATEAFNAEVTRIQGELEDRDTAVEKAEQLLAEKKPPLEKKDRTDLEEAVKEATAIEFEAPAIPKELDEINAAIEELKKISYTEIVKSVKDATTALETSIRKCELVTAPTEEYVVKCLGTVDNIDKIEPVTEDHDPNGMLGKQGGYTAQVYFSSPLVKDPYGVFTDDIIENGTDGGGSVEVFTTAKEAKTREDYLAGFDSTGGFSSGSHKVIGSCVVRTSTELKASQQKELEADIIEALTKLDQ